MPKFISLAQIVLIPVKPYCAELLHKVHSFILEHIECIERYLFLQRYVSWLEEWESRNQHCCGEWWVLLILHFCLQYYSNVWMSIDAIVLIYPDNQSINQSIIYFKQWLLIECRLQYTCTHVDILHTLKTWKKQVLNKTNADRIHINMITQNRILNHDLKIDKFTINLSFARAIISWILLANTQS